MEGEVKLKIKTTETGVKMSLVASPMSAVLLLHCANHIFETVMQQGEEESAVAIQYLMFFAEQRSLEFETGNKMKDLLARSETYWSEFCTTDGIVILIATNIPDGGNINSIRAAFDNWEVRTPTNEKSSQSFVNYLNDKAEKFNTGHRAYTLEELFRKFATNYTHN